MRGSTDAPSQWGGRPVARTCGEIVPRCRAMLAGTVLETRLRTIGGAPCLEAVLDDGTGVIALHWIGRPAIPGIGAGARLSVEGTVSADAGAPRLLNPRYVFESSTAS